MTGAKQQSKASYENFAEVKCPLGNGRRKRSTGGVKPGQLAVSIANKAGSQASNVILFTRFDSRCQTCDTNTGECTVKVSTSTGECTVKVSTNTAECAVKVLVCRRESLGDVYKIVHLSCHFKI